MLLTDNASEWVETNLKVSTVLSKSNPTFKDILLFKSLLADKYPGRTIEHPPISFYVEISSLKQNHDKSLLLYYQQTLSLLYQIEGKDKTVEGSILIGLSILESVVLDIIIRAFLKGLFDKDVKQSILRVVATSGRLLHSLYIMAEESKTAQEKYNKIIQE